MPITSQFVERQLTAANVRDASVTYVERSPAGAVYGLADVCDAPVFQSYW